ncbi:MAG: hypothetical protein V3U65_09960 [Granulosicoccaceae bacterium]
MSDFSTMGSQSVNYEQVESARAMAKNLNFFFDRDGTPRARGPHSETILMTFLEVDVQGSEYVCHDLMEDITAIEDQSAEQREFSGNAHTVEIKADGITIESLEADPLETYTTGLKHFREILEDWEAFILGGEDDMDDMDELPKV